MLGLELRACMPACPRARGVLCVVKQNKMTVQTDFYRETGMSKLEGREGFDGIVVVLLESRGHIYRSTKINLEYKTRQDQILVYPILPNNLMLNIPRSHNGSDADNETGEVSEGKPTDTPHSRNGRRIVEVVTGVETDEVAQAGGSPLCRLSM